MLYYNLLKFPVSPSVYPLGKRTPVSHGRVFSTGLGISATFSGIFLAIFALFLRWDWLCYAGIVISISIHIVSIVEGLIYLSKKEWEFYTTYLVNHRGWF
jgi:hypothetical protein